MLTNSGLTISARHAFLDLSWVEMSKVGITPIPIRDIRGILYETNAHNLACPFPITQF